MQVLAGAPGKDGLTKIAMDIASRGRERYDFGLATPFVYGNETVETFRSLGSEIHSLPPKKKVRTYMAALKAILQEGRYDAIYIHGNSAAMFLEARPGKRSGKVVFTHCHDTSTKHPAVHALLKPAFNRAVDVKIGCSSKAAAWAYDGNRTFVVTNGVQAKKYRFDEEERQTIRKELGIETSFVCGFIGRFAHQKNPLQLLDIFKEVTRQKEEAVLLLIGDGDLREAMEKHAASLAISDHVRFLGEMEDVVPVMQGMDVILMPSLYEGLPLVPLEAQANGLPVILSDACTEEVFATDYCVPASLEETAAAWADKAISTAATLERGGDVSRILQTKGLTDEAMYGTLFALIEDGLEGVLP